MDAAGRDVRLCAGAEYPPVRVFRHLFSPVNDQLKICHPYARNRPNLFFDKKIEFRKKSVIDGVKRNAAKEATNRRSRVMPDRVAAWKLTWPRPFVPIGKETMRSSLCKGSSSSFRRLPPPFTGSAWVTETSSSVYSPFTVREFFVILPIVLKLIQLECGLFKWIESKLDPSWERNPIDLLYSPNWFQWIGGFSMFPERLFVLLDKKCVE